jgi:hypothetical protein
VFVAQQGADDFQLAVKAAKAEFAAIHDAGSVDPAACAAEAAVLAKDPF